MQKALLERKDHLPFRQGVIGLVVNQQNQVLIVQMTDYQDNEWRFPGGGIENNETPEKALLRELSEELGVSEFEILKKSRYKTQYDWSEELITKRFLKKGEKYRGQQQFQYLVRYLGQNKLPFDHKELNNIKWVAPSKLSQYLIFPGQLEMARKVIAELLQG